MKQIQIQTAFVCFDIKTTQVYVEVFEKNGCKENKGTQ